jgi:ribose-phosphate pyrophosphokinase
MPTLNKRKVVKNDFVLLGGKASWEIAQKISKELRKPLGKVEYTVFPNQETRVRVLEKVEQKTVFIIQSLSSPSETSLMELFLLANAAKYGGAKKIIAVTPWLAYSPQDKIFRAGEALSSALIASLIRAAGIKEIILLDVHSSKNIDHLLENSIKVHHLSALPIFAEKLKKIKGSADWIVLRVDKGADERSINLAKLLNLPVVNFEKKRDRKTGSVSFEKITLNLAGKKIISFDDFISTGGSLLKSVEIAKKNGATSFTNCSTHGILALDATVKIQKSSLNNLFLTDSYPIPKEKRIQKIKIISCAKIIAEKISELISLES